MLVLDIRYHSYILNQSFWNKMKTLRKWFIFLAAASLLGFAVNTYATTEAPDTLIKRISKEVMDAAKANKEIKKGDQKQIYTLVETKIFPHVDFQRMTSLAAGRYWRQATPEQKEQLTKEFRDLLVYTYSNAVSKVDNQRLEFKPLRMSPDTTEVIVYSRIIQPNGGEPIELSYRMAKTDNNWKIFDVNVMGAWLVETYKGTFANEISRSGIDGLIKTLSQKNKQLASGKPANSAQ